MEKLSKLLIASITPYFLEKEIFWFGENLQEMLQAAKTQQFFQDNIVFLEAGKKQDFMMLLRKLDEMGYEKVFTVSGPGEFSQKGGLIEIFPVNTLNAMRLDFLGNTLETIQALDLKIEDEQKSREVLKKKLTSQKLFSDLKNLKPGDFLVHLDHGVARFKGIEKIQDTRNNNETEEYYILEYSHGDKLFVPVGLERKLSRYVGFADPAVARLGSAIWQATKRKVKEEVEKMAKELLALYATKETMTRAPYQVDEDLESQLNSGFYVSGNARSIAGH